MKTDKIVLNGKTVDAVIFGDGQQQIDLFNTVATYAREHKWQFQSCLQNSRFPGMIDNVVLAFSDKYDMRVIETKIPGIEAPLNHARYRSYVLDKETNQSQSEYGTISHYFWDLVQELRTAQK